MWNNRRVLGYGEGNKILNNPASFKIIVPIYDEFDNLKEFIKLLQDKNTDISRFLFVNNGSLDKNISDLLVKNSLNYITSEVNLGFGGGIKLGISNVTSNYVCWMPCNLKVSPVDVLNFIKEIKVPKENSLYKAIRSERPQIDNIKTLIFSFVQSLLLNSYIYDSGGTPTMVHRKFFENFDNFPNDYTFETYVMLKAKYSNFKIERLRVKYGKRKYGKSHWQNGLLTEIQFIKNMYTSSKNWKF